MDDHCEESPQKFPCASALCFPLTPMVQRARSVPVHAKCSTVADRAVEKCGSFWRSDDAARTTATSTLSVLKNGAACRSVSAPRSRRRTRNENLPPNISELLNSSMDDPFASTEDEFSESDVYPNFLRETSDASNCVLSKLCIESSEPISFFRPSRFSNIPPTIQFTLPNRKVEKPKKSIRRNLKWCQNSLMPKVVRKVLANSHFQIVPDDQFWIGYWGRHLKTSAFKKVLPYQKINHFPGTFNLGRKDRLWLNIRHMMVKHGAEVFNIMPKTYILPRDIKKLRTKMKENGQLAPIILKPPASARGTGVRLIHRHCQIPRKESLIAQVYIDNPCLIYGSKFDLRLYVYVSCFNPLRIYLYEEGLVRFATVKYSKSLSNLANRLMHLTNYSVNKHASEDIPNKSITGIKWTVRQLWKYFEKCGIDSKRLMQEIVDLILKTFVSCEPNVNSYVGLYSNYPFAFHELFGFDIVLDGNLKPWLLEVNISPSLQSSTNLDVAVKTPLSRDILNLAGIQVPDKSQIHIFSPRLSPEWLEPPKPSCLDYRTKPNDLLLSASDLTKQQWFVDNFLETGKTNSSILDNLTPNDLRVLISTEDEYDRRGQFVRIFPSPTSTRYLQYFDKPTYYNLLLEEWTGQYFHIRDTGVALLESFCKQRMHLQQSYDK